MTGRTIQQAIADSQSLLLQKSMLSGSHPTVTVFGREWPTRDGATLKANWALGMYLLRQDEARSAAAAGSA